MKLTVAYHGGTRYDITSGRHRIVTDRPAAAGGQDAGMSPVELFVGSMASCVSYFVGHYCAHHAIPCAGLSVDAEWTMAEGPHRVGQITIAIHLPHRLTPEHKERVLRVAQDCTVYRSIAISPSVAIKLNPHGHTTHNHES